MIKTINFKMKIHYSCVLSTLTLLPCYSGPTDVTAAMCENNNDCIFASMYRI